MAPVLRSDCVQTNTLLTSPTQMTQTLVVPSMLAQLMGLKPAPQFPGGEAHEGTVSPWRYRCLSTGETKGRAQVWLCTGCYMHREDEKVLEYQATSKGVRSQIMLTQLQSLAERPPRVQVPILTQTSPPTLGHPHSPRPPWQMSVRVAPSRMN